MSYRDEQGGHDSRATRDGLHLYGEDGTPKEGVVKEEKETEENTAERRTEGKQSRKPKPGMLERARRALLGEKTTGEKAAKGVAQWRAAGGFGQVLSKLASPKMLAGLVLGTGIGVFGILGIFTSYKNDDAIRNDPPIQCEPGSIILQTPGGSGEDVDVQETVNILYDIFCNQFGYSETAFTAMLACMHVETGVNPDRLESDYLLTGAKDTFDGIAGPGTNPQADAAQQAYWVYGEAFKTGGGWNQNPFYIVDGHMCCGIGLIQWTAGRANEFIQGLDKVSLDVSPMDAHYQAAYLIAEAQTKFPAVAPGSEFSQMSDVREATRVFFGTMVFGNPAVQYGNSHLEKRLAAIDVVTPYVLSAQANSQFTMDAVTMAEQLAEEGFSSSVSAAQGVQLCVNDTFIITSDIANAAVSISFLERGDYEDVNGAYGTYRRSARSPIIINDWDWVEGKNTDPDNLSVPNSTKTYGSERGVTSDPKKTWTFYDNTMGKTPGKLDLIACTEYYYFAHLIAFPQETGTGGKAGYFSSCDRGTATAVRIAGADDKFPAGNPLYQLMWAAGGAKQGAKHNENARGPEGAGYLWKFSGFMRGSDWYSASGNSTISPGTVMISWSVRAANGLLGTSDGSATTGGEEGMLDPADKTPTDVDDPDNAPTGGYGSKKQSIKLAGLRWPMSRANTTRHIITYVGDATVQSFWGLDWLYQQFQLFDDCDRLVRKDLTEQIPEVMQNGLAFKAEYAKKSGDAHMTFYKAKADGSRTHDDEKEFEPANNRLIEFNSKTGLPEFRSWEQIYIRLIHNSDDDAAIDGENDQLYETAKPFGNGQSADGTEGDGYLDKWEKDEIDAKIEQYDGVNGEGEQTYGNKYFYRDWNSLGVAGSTPSVVDNHKNDYTDPTRTVGNDKLIWYDKTNGNALEPWTHQRGADASRWWRYELVTDFEYRTNQFLRFGLASMMCSYPSEEDADTFQSGGEGNDTGHIIGNIYRRYSRIPDRVDSSGRYYYYNTVVSNDMLQDLVQLYTEDKNAYTEGDRYIKDAYAGARGKNERNYGPMYLIGVGRSAYAGKYKPAGTTGWIDRRYGLTADDIATIAGGIEGNRMGEADSEAILGSFTHILLEPMHAASGTSLMNNAQKSLYDNTMDSLSSAHNNAHEGAHKYNVAASKPYGTDIYSMNPFLMLESEKGLNAVEEYTDDVLDWTAGEKTGLSVRNDVDGELTGEGSGNKAKGVSPAGSGGAMDDRLAWIDRHYYVTGSGSIGTFAYQVLALQPSAGSKTSSSGYAAALKGVKTLNAGYAGQANADNLYGSMGLVQYTDYIYANDAGDNKQMAKRLFGKDDRNKDGATTVDGARDDYNRREFYVIPYYHTHAQQCDHSALIGYNHYDLKCEWQNNTGKNTPTKADNLTLGGPAKIDTQLMLNGQESLRQEWHNTTLASTCSHVYNDSTDYGDTISFDTNHVINRGKYNMSQVLASIEHQDVRYFADTGDEIAWNAKPYIHVQCDGWTQPACCSGSTSCEECAYCPGNHPNPCDCDNDDGSCSGGHGTHYCDTRDCVKPDCSNHLSNACPCGGCTNYCHACKKLLKCGETCPHECGELLEMGRADPSKGCHPHKECDDWARSSNVAVPCTCPYDTGLNHHKDGGTVIKEYQTDKCHYEYGCNALEYLYHNTEPDSNDGLRKHYRLKDHGDHTPQTLYNENTMELFDVNAVYMVIPAAPGVDMKDFDIRDYIRTTQFDHTYNDYQGKYKGSQDPWHGAAGGSDFRPDGYPWNNGAVIPDKCNLLQQVTYDENGWVTNNWQDMIDLGLDGSFLKPLLTGQYVSSLEYLTNAKHSSAVTVGYKGSADQYPGDASKGLLQYFTIEGNSIHRDRSQSWEGWVAEATGAYGTVCPAEYISHSKHNGTTDDLVALEPVRNRVGYGKSLDDQYIDSNDATIDISQGNGPGPRGSSAQPIEYDRNWHNESPDAANLHVGGYVTEKDLGNHGWGEVAVVGTQHPMDPVTSTAGGTGYGNCAPDLVEGGGNISVAGPDGSKGNNVNPFGPSLLREIIGDEHVVHVKFDTQDFAGLTRQDAGDNGRDFMFYVDKKQAADELGMDEDDMTPKDYQSETSAYYTSHVNKFKTQPNVYGLFKSMDKDVLYKNYYTGELTDRIYAENVPPHAPTDQKYPNNDSTLEPNKPNIPLKAVPSHESDQATNGGDATGQTVISDKEAKEGLNRPNTGDYRNWVAHASRGTRGMMTQYLNFGGFFKDVYKNGPAAQQDKNNAYMLFEVVMRTDVCEADGDAYYDEYGNPMGSNDWDKDRDWSLDGERVSQREGFVYRTAPGDAVIGVDGTGLLDQTSSWGRGDSFAFSDTYGQGSNSHWKNMIDLYNATMSETRQYGY